jgi:hypothetical protein
VSLALFAAVSLAGCQPSEPDEKDSSSTTTRPTTSPTSASTTSAGSSEVGDVTLSTTGGVAGVDDVIVVQADGTILRSPTLRSDPEPTGETMPADELDALHRLVGTEEFAALEDTYIPDGLCCDQFHYELSAQVGDATITSATADGVDSPEVLQQVVSQLHSLA